MGHLENVLNQAARIIEGEGRPFKRSDGVPLRKKSFVDAHLRREACEAKVQKSAYYIWLYRRAATAISRESSDRLSDLANVAQYAIQLVETVIAQYEPAFAAGLVINLHSCAQLFGQLIL